MEKFVSMARILSHLGEQLISSSSVALLELIKNSYDAGSPWVKITIDQSKRTMIIEDKGHGMSYSDIQSKFLVIGTTDRLDIKNDLKKSSSDKRVPLGEKGLGRFATMKLGEKLVLLSKISDSKKANLLLVNWNHFSYVSNRRLEDINIHLNSIEIDTARNKYPESFTKIKIYDLKDFCEPTVWGKKAFEEFYRNNFSKYINPFKPQYGFQIKLEVILANGDRCKFYPEDMDRKFLSQAPYQIKGKFSLDRYNAEYYIRNDDGQEVKSILTNIIVQDIDAKELSGDGEVGEFEFEFYFFNRKGSRLKEIKGYENTTKVRNLLNQYNGGIMIYRDNFRVLPYATAGNDWLELDRDKWSLKGVRFNTIQTVGAIHITSLGNPNLKDQTNREGLINNQAYENLKIILQSIISTLKFTVAKQFEKYNTKSNKRSSEEITESIQPFKRIIETISNNAEDIKRNLRVSSTYGNEMVSAVEKISKSVNELKTNYDNIKMTAIELDKRVIEVEEQQRMILDLAGIGMTAETAAHEIQSYLDRLNLYLRDFLKKYPQEKSGIMNLLQNTKSLETVVSRLDVQSITKRRTKSKINLVDVIKEITNSKLRVWEMNGNNQIQIKIITNGDNIIKANEGMIIQVFDNLLTNSHYWLLKHLINFPNEHPTILIRINCGIVEFSDNGFGIPELDTKFIFEPFFTRRKEGRGLGLYIVHELLNYHEASIELFDEENNFGNKFKFVIDFTNSTI